MRHLALSLALWFLASSPPLSRAEALLTCPCHAKGYPRCDCGEGCLCRCVRLEQWHTVPLALDVAISLVSPFTGIYESEKGYRPAIVSVTQEKASGHYHATWYLDGEPTYQSIIQRTGPFTAEEHWWMIEPWANGTFVNSRGAWVVVGRAAHFSGVGLRKVR